MALILERGETRENSVDFVRYTGTWSIDTKIIVPRWEWEAWGEPERVKVEVTPVY